MQPCNGWRQNKIRLVRIDINDCECMGIGGRLLNIVSQVTDVDRCECMVSHVRELLKASRYFIVKGWYGGMLVLGHYVDRC